MIVTLLTLHSTLQIEAHLCSESNLILVFFFFFFFFFLGWGVGNAVLRTYLTSLKLNVVSHSTH